MATVAAFCLPWSADLDHALGRPLSLLFNLAVVALIALWAVDCPGGWRVVPRSCRIFLGVVWLHLLVYYGLVDPGAFTWQPQVVDLGVRHAVRDPVAHLVFKFVLYQFYMIALSGLLKTPAAWRAVAGGMLAGHVLLVFVNDPLATIMAGERYSGGFANPNAYGEIAYVMIATGGLVAIAATGGARLLGFALAVLGLAGTLLSVSRGVLFAVACGAIILAVAGRRRYLAGIFVALGLLALLAALLPGGLVEQVLNRTAGGSDNARLLIWASYLRELPHYIWTGTGLGREMTVISSGIYYDRIWNPHNSYLKALVGFGLPGFIALLILVGGATRELWLRYRQAPASRPDAWFLAGIIGGYAVMLIFADRLEGRATWQLFGMAYAVMGRTGIPELPTLRKRGGGQS